MRYKVKDNIKEEMLRVGGQLTPDVRGLTLEDYLIGCELVENPLREFEHDKYSVPINEQIVTGTILATDHPMPYFNVHVHIPRSALEEIE